VRNITIAAALAAALVVPAPAMPAEPDSRMLEEVVVTATRREESLQDVPVSVGVVTGEQIRQLSLQNLDQLSAYVPGLNVVEGGEQTGISIRGFGSGINFGFDQSVGLFIDGIYAGRERQFRARFLDISSVEVLRGPQNTLFGKNTISGAIIVNTGRPSQETSLDLRAEHTPRTDGQQYEVVANGGLTETLSGRLALRYYDNDGYLSNTLTGDEEEQEEDWVARASFLWEPSDTLSVLTKLEYSEYERIGRNYNVSQVSGLATGRPTCFGAPPPCAAASPEVDPPAQLGVYQNYHPGFPFDDLSHNSKQRETADVEATNAVIRADWELDAGTVTSITGYSGYESEDGRDVDWTPTNFLYEPISQEFDQYSQELQFTSRSYERFDYLVGVHVFENDFYVDRRTDINIEPYLFVPPDTAGPEWRYAQLRFLDETTQSQSIYGQMNYHFTPRWTLSAGLRWNREEQTADDRYFLSEFGTDRFLELDDAVLAYFQPYDPANLAELQAVATAAGGDNAVIANVCTFLCANVAGIIGGGRIGGGKLVEKDWSPELTLSWDATDNSMYYAKVTRGHKAGGFNSQAVGQEATDETFKDETVTGYELGGKFTLLDGMANLNFSLFRLDFDDQQVSVWVGDGFDVGNAAEARSQGLEMDGRWLVGERLQLNGSFIWLDARYRSYPNSDCSIPQRFFPDPEPGCELVGGVPLQDLTGKRFASTFSGNVGIGYLQPLGRGLELLLRADAVYYGDQENARDSTIEQDDRTLVDLGATLRSTDLSWELGLLVQNATDEEFYWYEFEAPAQVGTRIGFPGAPRRVTLRASYHL
jgi:outer membrane receptor protein involved in Fe transport